MALTDAKVRNVKPKAKPYKIYDGDGLFLLVDPSGSKYWRLKYSFLEKEKLLALGVYPDVSLGEARERRLQARKTLAAGNDPGEVKKEAKRAAVLEANNTFEVIAWEWYQQRIPGWEPSTARKMKKYLENYLIPALGTKSIAAIRAPEILSKLRELEERGILNTVKTVMQMCGRIFMYAIATGRTEINPVPNLRGALKTPVTKHQAYLKAAELPEFLKKLETYDGTLLTKLALRFLMLTFVRTKESSGAEWKEMDLDNAEWRIPAERMKMTEEHIVPLSRQAVATLRELHKLSGKGNYVFPNHRNSSKHMSENAMLFAIYRMGYHSRATGHGFRSTASTILNENGFMPDVIERQLAHSERNKVRAAYNHAQYLPERRKMMQWWADYLDKAAKKK